MTVRPHLLVRTITATFTGRPGGGLSQGFIKDATSASAEPVPIAVRGCELEQGDAGAHLDWDRPYGPHRCVGGAVGPVAWPRRARLVICGVLLRISVAVDAIVLRLASGQRNSLCDEIRHLVGFGSTGPLYVAGQVFSVVAPAISIREAASFCSAAVFRPPRVQILDGRRVAGDITEH